MTEKTIDLTLVSNDVKLKLKDNGDGTHSPYVEAELDVADSVTIDTGVKITGETLEDGGSGLLGWLSSIRKGIVTTLMAVLPTARGANGGLKIEGVASGTTVPVTATPAASEVHVGEVTGSTINVSVTPTITAGAYSALDTIGGIQTIANAARASGKPTTLQSLVITDLAMVSPNFRIWFFNANPATGTYTDNAALDIDDTDLGLCVGVINCSNGEWVNGLDNGVLVYTNIGLVMTPAATSLYAVVETIDAETFITTSDLTFRYGFYRE